MTIPQSEKIVAVLQDNYPNARLTERSPEAYRTMIGDAPFEVVLAALEKSMRASPEFCPSAPAIANAIRAILDPAPTWELGWLEVMGQVRSVGSWGVPVLKDSAAAEVVRSIGWSTFCNAPDPKYGGDARDLAFLQTRFREVYQAASERRRNADTLDALPEPTRLAITDRGAA